MAADNAAEQRNARLSAKATDGNVAGPPPREAHAKTAPFPTVAAPARGPHAFHDLPYGKYEGV